MTIRLFTMPTLRTGTARVSWVNQPDFYASPSRFVTDKGAKLIKGPGMPFVTIFMPNSYSLSDACKVFQSECLARLNGFSYQSFCYPMVRVLLKTMLFAREFFEATRSRACSYFLQDLTALVIVLANFLHLSSTERLPGTIGCKVDNAQVNPQGLRGLDKIRGFLVLSDVQVVSSLSPDQISTANLPLWVNQHVMLSFPQDHATGETALQSEQRYSIKRFQTEGTIIITDTPTRPKLWTGLTFLLSCGLDGFNSLGTRTNCQLRQETEASAGLSIDTMVSGVGISDLFLPTHYSNPGCRFVKALLCLLQDGLMTIYVQFDTDSSYDVILHKNSIAQAQSKVKGGVAAAPVLSSQPHRMG